jgi:urease accessory protein
MSRPLEWQLIDSAFPSGGFAHSGGLEAAWQSGEVTTDAELQRFVADSLWQTGNVVLPLARAAHGGPHRLEELDAQCEAFLTNAVANRASRLQGRALLAACSRIWPTNDLAAIESRCRSLHGHLAPLAGAVLCSLDVPLRVTERMLLFTAARGVLAAAVRLGIVGPYRAQRLQFECGATLERVLTACADRGLDDLTQTAPLVDLLQSTHDRLYSRLFQS